MEIELATKSKLPEQKTKQSDEQEDHVQDAHKSGLAAVDFKNLKWTRKDIHLTVLVTLITFGDAVEIYLPGVITQSASSELGVSQAQEGLLGIILYLCLALSYFVLPAIKSKMKRREALLVSLYISILSTVVCSLVPNYWTLIVSRALLGLCIGLNMSICGLYFTEHGFGDNGDAREG